MTSLQSIYSFKRRNTLNCFQINFNKLENLLFAHIGIWLTPKTIHAYFHHLIGRNKNPMKYWPCLGCILNAATLCSSKMQLHRTGNEQHLLQPFAGKESLLKMVSCRVRKLGNNTAIFVRYSNSVRVHTLYTKTPIFGTIILCVEYNI